MRRILPYILATLTQCDRGKVIPGQDFEWSSESWTHNVFRAFELIFWRRIGIRAEMSAAWEKGVTTYRFHTLESFIAHLEGMIRGFFPRKWPVRIYIPMLATPFGSIPASPFLLAVAFDNSGAQQSAGTNPTITMTVSGSNGILFGFPDDSSNTFTGCTWNLAAMTSVTSQTNLNFTGMYTILAPTTGSHSFVASSSSGNARALCASYSGVKQSALDASTTQANASTSSFVPTITTNVNNCMIVVSGQNNQGSATVSVGNLRQSFGTGRYCGDNTAATAGSNSMTWGGVGTAAWGAVVASIAPAAAAVNSNFLAFF